MAKITVKPGKRPGATPVRKTQPSGGSSGGGGSTDKADSKEGVRFTFTDPQSGKVVSEVFESREAGKRFIEDITAGRPTETIIKRGTTVVGIGETPEQLVERKIAEGEKAPTIQTVEEKPAPTKDIIVKARTMDALGRPQYVMVPAADQRLVIPPEEIIILGKTAPEPATPIRPVSTVQPATKEQVAAMRRQESIAGQFLEAIKTPFFEEARVGEQLRGTPAQTAGALAGSILLIAPAGKVTKVVKGATKGAKAAATAVKTSKAVQATQRAFSSAAATRLGRFAKDLGITAAKGVAIVETGKFAGRVTAPAAQKEYIQPELLAAVERQKEAQVRQQQWYKQLAAELPVRAIPGGLGERAFRSVYGAEYEDIARQALIQQGIRGERLETAVKAAQRQSRFMATSEALALLEISRSSERIGRQRVTEAFKQLGKKGTTVSQKRVTGQLFKTAFPAIAEAGAVEGFTQEISQQRARFKDIDIKTAGLMGALGAGTAGLLGGTIAATRLRKPATSKIIEYSTFVADPFEKPGDILQDLAEAAQKRITGKTAARPVIYTTAKPEDIVSFGVRGAKAPKAAKAPVVSFAPIPAQIPEKAPKRTRVVSPLDQLSAFGQTFGTPAQTPVETKRKKTRVTKAVPILTPVEVPTFQQIIGGRPQPSPPTTVPPEPVPPVAPVDVPVETGVPVDTDTITPTPTPTNIFNQIFGTETPVPVPVTAPISIPVSIPARTPQLRVPPPIPFVFPFSLGAGATRRGKGIKRVNELEAGRVLLQNMLGGGRPVRRSSSKKRGKR